jgi:TolA-binding protein
VAAAVALFGVASFAAVGQWTGVLPRWVEKVMAPEPVVVPVPKVRASSVKVELPPEPEPAPVVVPKAPAPALNRSAAPLTPAQSAHPERVPGEARTQSNGSPRAEREPTLGPSELFAAANAARIRGDRAEAALRYGELLRKFPSSDEARLTHATLGRLLLDSGDARGALAQLDVYLALGDETLREEAMSARARALALLGRTSEEAAAWGALLQLYPDSVHAERARARLQELR